MQIDDAVRADVHQQIDAVAFELWLGTQRSLAWDALPEAMHGRVLAHTIDAHLAMLRTLHRRVDRIVDLAALDVEGQFAH